MRVRDPEKRMSLLKCGRLPVVSFLSELPQTEHDPQSFAVDLTLFTVNVFLLIFIVKLHNVHFYLNLPIACNNNANSNWNLP